MSETVLPPTTFTGAESESFDLGTAAKWTAAEREQSPGQVRAYFFGRDIIEQILKQPGCMGLRIYYALDPLTGVRHLLMVGAEANLNDQLPPLLNAAGDAAPPAGALSGAAEYIIAEMATPCPSGCGSANVLNGYL